MRIARELRASTRTADTVQYRANHSISKSREEKKAGKRGGGVEDVPVTAPQQPGGPRAPAALRPCGPKDLRRVAPPADVVET